MKLTSDSSVHFFSVSYLDTSVSWYSFELVDFLKSQCVEAPWKVHRLSYQWEDCEDSVQSLLLFIIYHSSFGTVVYQNLSVSKST